jgi:N-acetylglucosaminyl-diphospho-decaprenol L-rhamnosyltransferase
MNATIVIPVFNQLHYTRQCLESLNASGCSDAMVVVVNNASTDGTKEYLAGRPRLRVINNLENRACAAAWNQGFQASTTQWTVFLNNDVVLPPAWLENLIAFAEKENVDVASPATGEGELGYDLAAYARDFMARMKDVRRKNKAHGVCFMVHRRVMETIGSFDENFRKGGNEDEDFFIRAQRAGFKLAVTGGSYLHHFGSVTRRALAAEQGCTRHETIGYFRSKWKITWFRRRWMQGNRKLAGAWLKWNERLRFGHTLREWRMKGKTYYR